MENRKTVLSIVVPCYNEQEVIDETAKQLSVVLTDLIKDGSVSSKSFILFVNDGSKDETWEKISVLHKSNPLVCGVNLAKNTGHQNALMAGLQTAKSLSDVMVTIDADLQDDVSAIKSMIAEYFNGNEVIYGVRSSRKKDTFFKKFTAQLFYKFMSFLGVQTVYNHADYRMMSRRAVEYLFEFKERNLFLRGIVPTIGFKSSTVYYERSERFAGETKYPFSKMLNFAIDGVTSFSVKPLRIIFIVGFLFLFLTIIAGIYVLYQYLNHNVVSGWSSLILSLWFIGSIVIISLGIIGEYIGKIYTEVKGRPRFNIESILLKEN